jgi:hypothetical protein
MIMVSCIMDRHPFPSLAMTGCGAIGGRKGNGWGGEVNGLGGKIVATQ